MALAGMYYYFFFVFNFLAVWAFLPGFLPCCVDFLPTALGDFFFFFLFVGLNQAPTKTKSPIINNITAIMLVNKPRLFSSPSKLRVLNNKYARPASITRIKMATQMALALF